MSQCSTGELNPVLCWEQLTKLLSGAISGADVKEITDKDFDQQGELVFRGRAVRVMYFGTRDAALENTRTVYESVHQFLVIVGDDDRRSTRDQAIASLKLATEVKAVLAGARLSLHVSEATEPITVLSTEAFPIKTLGVGYSIAIEVPGPAVFPGLHANPFQEPQNG